MTNHEAAQKVLNSIKANGFKLNNLNCETKHDISEVTFSVKGLYGWQFGMWACTSGKFCSRNEDEAPPIVLFFCKHKFNELRFAPAYNYFHAELEEWEFSQSSVKWWIYNITNILMMIKRHPFISYTMDEYKCKYYEKSYILNFFNGTIREIKKKLLNLSKNCIEK